MVSTNLILLPPKPLQIAPSGFIHRVRVAQIRRRLVILPRGRRVALHAPAVAEAVGQLVDGEDELALRGAAFLDACAEGLALDGRRVRGRRREVCDCLLRVFGAAPAVSERVSCLWV